MVKSIILASSSPRRYKLLKQIDLDFEVIPSNFDEKNNTHLAPFQLVKEFAKGKSLDVASKLDDGLVIGADTLVIFGEEILEKPKNKKEAKEMISLLSGNKHQVITGVCLVNASNKAILIDQEITDVWFKKLREKEIDRYISRGEWTDKAGAYGIQGYGALIVEKIFGCYYNVVGLPLFKLGQMLDNFGIKI